MEKKNVLIKIIDFPKGKQQRETERERENSQTKSQNSPFYVPCLPKGHICNSLKKLSQTTVALIFLTFIYNIAMALSAPK